VAALLGLGAPEAAEEAAHGESSAQASGELWEDARGRELVVKAARHLGEKRSRGEEAVGEKAKPRVVEVVVTVVLTQLACDRWMTERMDGEEEPCGAPGQ
jgi:hypothetical protein